MSAETEKRFYEVLGAVPDVPAGILKRVERAVRPSVFKRVSLAACLAAAFIVPALFFTNMFSPPRAYADDDEIVDEMLYAFEYLSGDFDDDDLDDLFIDNQITLLSEGEFLE
jgi:hypothetical protein